MVKDKINYRAQGPRTVLTRQTVQGRANDGGLRIGEMERDGVIAHGATAFLKQSMLDRGDDYYVAICNTTGTIAAYNGSKNIFYSMFADGPLKFNGSTVDNLNIENISRYGRSFSIVRIPYSFKLLIHELQCMNIQMRLITEDNIDQFDSMAFQHTRYLDQEKIITKSGNSDDAKTQIKITQSNLLDVDSDTESQEQLQDIQANIDDESDGTNQDTSSTGIPEDEDESDLDPETIKSIRRAEEYAESVGDDDSDDGSDNEPVNIGEDLPESALGLDNIDGNPEKLKISNDFASIKNSMEANTQQQMDQIAELEKSVEQDRLKDRGIVIRSSEDDQDSLNKKSILTIDESKDDPEEENESDIKTITKPITLN